MKVPSDVILICKVSWLIIGFTDLNKFDECGYLPRIIFL